MRESKCKLIKNCLKPWLRFTLRNGLGHSKIVFVCDFLFKSDIWNQNCHKIHIFRLHRDLLNLTQQAFSDDQLAIHLLTWFQLPCLKLCKPSLENTPVWLSNRNLSFGGVVCSIDMTLNAKNVLNSKSFKTSSIKEQQVAEGMAESKKLHQIWVKLLLALTNRVQFGYY